MNKRRIKGSGAIFPRKDGRWSGYVDLGEGDGPRKRKVIYGRTPAEVENRIRGLLNDMAAGVPPPSRSPQLGHFLQRWLVAVRPSIRPSTYVSYEGVVRLHIAPRIGRITLEKLTIDHVAGMVADLQGSHRLSNRSVKYSLLILRNALNKAVRWGLVARNVATLTDGPRVEDREARVLSPEETVRLLGAARGEPIEALVVLSVSTGLRMGEALGLQWANVDLNRRQLRIDKALHRLTGQGQVLAETKTRRSRRTLILPVMTAESLRKHRDRQNEQRRATGRDWHNGDFVFTTSSGRPFDPRNVQRMFRRILRKARLPRMRFHDLRHSCASLLLAQHTDPRVIMETLGHSRISVTMDMYAHVMPVLKHEAADAMDRSIGAERDR
jgi:integrase